MSDRPSARIVTAPTGRFPWSFILETFMKICRENRFVERRTKCRTFYRKTKVRFIVAADIRKLAVKASLWNIIFSCCWQWRAAAQYVHGDSGHANVSWYVTVYCLSCLFISTFKSTTETHHASCAVIIGGKSSRSLKVIIYRGLKCLPPPHAF
jgi:hypothetical protein